MSICLRVCSNSILGNTGHQHRESGQAKEANDQPGVFVNEVVLVLRVKGMARSVMTAIRKGGVGILHVRGGRGGRCHCFWNGHSEIDRCKET